MSWRDRLQKGRFRNAAFLIESHDAGGGRRLALHEYPLRDEPYAEDIGRKAREFSVECYVLGADYMDARDNLITAFEQKGPGALVHPYLGLRQVAVREYRLRESTKDGGIATFSVTFVEAGAAAEPDTKADTAKGVLAAVDNAIKKITESFAKTFSVLTRAAHVAQSAVQSVEQTLARVTRLVGSVTGSIATLIRTPANLAAVIVGAVGKLKVLIHQPADALRLYGGLFKSGASSPTVPQTTEARRQQAVNQQAIQQLVQRAAVIEACRETALGTFTTGDSALAAMATLTEAIDEQLAAVGVVDGRPVDDDVYAALVDLRAAVARDLTVRAAKLPRTVRYTPPATLPALVIAHHVHDDAARDAEIVARNAIRHPGFVPGGRPLEVLADA